ncbi:MAG: hypothetical protein AAGC68_05680 [Verrucomicrobiota bacterium]
MKLSAPSKPLFLVSAILFVVGILAKFGVIGAAVPFLGWILIAAYVVLAIGCLMTGM